MPRLIGYMANRADRMRDAFQNEREALGHEAGNGGHAWGIGFYQGDDVLHKKQPNPDREPVSWESVVAGVRSDCAVAHVRAATVGGFSVDNTHPFRLRQWLFAHVGTIARFEAVRGKMYEQLPDFLRRNVRGETDSELLFHTVLARLHEQGHLERRDPHAEWVVEALRDTVDRIDELTGAPRESTLNLILANGRQMFGLRHGPAFGYVEQVGLKASAEGEAREERPGSPLLKYVFLVSGGDELPKGYTAIDPDTMIVVQRDLEVSLVPV